MKRTCNLQFHGIMTDLLKFKRLPPNWDSHGASEVGNLQFDNSKTLLAFFRNDSVCLNADCYPNPNGSISFTWIGCNGKISLEVGMSTYSYYVASENGGKVSVYNKQPFDNIRNNELKRNIYCINDLLPS